MVYPQQRTPIRCYYLELGSSVALPDMASGPSSRVDLGGLDAEKLRFAAARLKIGEIFDNFDDFDFSIDAWCFVNNRSCQKVKAKAIFKVRICRYGAAVRLKKPPGQDEITAFMSEATSSSSNAAHDSTENRRPTQEGSVVVASSARQRRAPAEGWAGEKRRYLTAGRLMFPRQTASAILQGEILKDDRKCPWRVRAQKSRNSGLISITVCNLTHTCPPHVHTWRGPQQNSKFLSRLLCDRVSLDPNAPIATLVEDLRDSFQKSAHYKQVWRMREHCRVLETVNGCRAPPIPRKRGRPRVIRVPNGELISQPVYTPSEQCVEGVEETSREFVNSVSISPPVLMPIESASIHSATHNATIQQKLTRPPGRSGISTRCGICHAPGHNKRTCSKRASRG